LSWVNLAETGITVSGLLRLPEKPFLFVNLSVEQITKDELEELRRRVPNLFIEFDRDPFSVGDYDRAVAQKANNYDVNGWLKLQEGDLDGAIIKYRKALSVKPDHVGAHNGLGLVLMEKGDLNRAIGEYREAIRIDPKESAPYYNLGIALRRVGRQAEAVWAIREFLQLLEDVPSNRVWSDRARTILVELEKER
jgi:tetratricopeptide (TPR) repeat protein